MTKIGSLLFSGISYLVRKITCTHTHNSPLQYKVENYKFKWMVETVIAVGIQRRERLLWAVEVRENLLKKVEFERHLEEQVEFYWIEKERMGVSGPSKSWEAGEHVMQFK